METACALAIDDQPEIRRLAAQDSRRPQNAPSAQIVARSASMRELLDLVGKIARTDAPVLIQGELGVGKTVVAREIHRRGRDAAGPFVHVACGVLSEAELSDKLFAEPKPAEKGSGVVFPDPASPPESPSGKRLATPFPLGREGTLFLDDISQLPLWAQVKLLDCLQQSTSPGREGHGSASAGPRVISASTCDLAAALAGNRFDAGLYYHLSVVQIYIPALRSRPQDIRALGEHFLAAANAMLGSPADATPRRFSEEAWQTLLSHDWPGNALQLASVVARAVMLADGAEIGQAEVAACLGEVRPGPHAERISVPLAGGLKEMELAIINEVLSRCRGNKAAAARSLRLHRRTLYRLLGK